MPTFAVPTRYDVLLSLEEERFSADGVGIPKGVSFSIGKYSAVVRPVVAALLGAMNRLQIPGNTPDEAAADREKVIGFGRELWGQTLGVKRGGRRAFDTIRAPVEAAMSAGRSPVIWIEGPWRGLPWELVRVPAEYAPAGRDQWLGEFAIIASLVHDERELEAADPAYFLPARCVIASAFGDEREDLPFLPLERKRMEALQQKFGTDVRILAPMLAGHSKAQEHVRTLTRFVSQPVPAQLFHLAGHHDDASGGGTKSKPGTKIATSPGGLPTEFTMRLRQEVAITDQDLSTGAFEFSDASVVFLNVCNGHTPSEWHAGGLAEYLMRRGAVAVVASSCRVGDEGAAEFSLEFLSRLLPVSMGGQGIPIGTALLQARNALLAKGRETGFCYRLFGPHEASLGDNRVR